MMKIEKKEKVKQYWRECARSMHCAMSRGAEQIAKIITSAQRDQWRRPKNQHRKSH